MKLRAVLMNWRNRTAMRRQLSLLVGPLVGLLMAGLIFYTYASQARSNLAQETESLTRILNMESQQVQEDLEELAAYALQLRNNATLMTILQQSTPLTYMENMTLEGQIRTHFYARNDIQRIDFWAVRQDAAYYMESQKRRVMPLEGVSFQELPEYEIFSQGPAWLSIRVSEGGNLEVTRTIIDSPWKDPLAVIRVIAAPERIVDLEERHGITGEKCYLFDHLGISLGTEAEAETVYDAAASGAERVNLAGEPCVLVSAKVGEGNFTLAAAKPLSVINRSLISLRNRTLILGTLAVMVTIAAVIWIIQKLTSPLTALEGRLHEIGSGDFSERENLEGSSEVISLSREMNRMTADISELIERNYLATLGERNAQLAALEAQTNPHFLYNTLQAVGAEVLSSGNVTAYRMITGLAGLLRYTIQSGNFVSLAEELDHVRKYLLLQEARYGNRLRYRMEGEEELLEVEVPKLGILSLVENSIVHGMKDMTDPMTIRIGYFREDHQVILRVKDDGTGIPPGELAEIRRRIADASVTLSQNIGLINLSARIRLLYHENADIEVKSQQDPPRETAVTIRIPERQENQGEGEEGT